MPRNDLVRLSGWAPCLLALLAFLPAVAGMAQLSVGLNLPRRDFVLFEPIVVEVTVLNSSGKNIVFSEDAKWLDFLVTKEKVELIPGSGSPVVDRDIYLDAASMQHVRVNLTYTHEIREPGNYQIQAMVRHKGRTYGSAIVPITVVNGAVQWKQNFVYINPKTDQEEVRDYELVAQKGDHGTRLLARIRDPKTKRVMCCTPLGTLLSFGEPAAKVDSHGSLHILNQITPRQFLYSKISPEGIREQPRFFLNATSEPELVESKDEGVIVVGGDEVGEDGRTLLGRDGKPASSLDALVNQPKPPARKKGEDEDEDDDEEEGSPAPGGKGR